MYIRKPIVDGQFYTSDPERLNTQILKFIEEGKESGSSTPFAIIAPHAGYVYSGPVAGSAYRAVRGHTYDTVIVLAPSHRYRIQGASVIGEGQYQTPLGSVPIDSEIGNALIDYETITFAPEVHEVEHSLEVQVPFIQTVLPDTPVVPVIVGTTDFDVCRNIGTVIADTVSACKKHALIVMSTDLSHYLPYETAVKTDSIFCNALETCDPGRVRNSVEKEKASACGYGPVLSGMTAARKLGATTCTVVDYRNSGDTAGPKSEVVGYCAAVLS